MQGCVGKSSGQVVTDADLKTLGLVAGPESYWKFVCDEEGNHVLARCYDVPRPRPVTMRITKISEGVITVSDE